MEKINILMATYNGRRYVAKQVESILNQTFTDFRLIISDDNSTDSTVKILEEYEKKDSRVEIYQQQKNLGVVGNFEFLIGKVRSEYFMFADQDDIWDNDKVEKTLKRLEEYSFDMVYTDLRVVNSRLTVKSKSYWKLKGFDYKIKKYNNFESLYLNNYVTGCTMMVKSKWINEFLPFPKTSKYVLHDYWIALMISQKGNIGYLDEPTMKYRQHFNNSVGSSTVSEKFETLEEVRNHFINVKLEHFDVFRKNERFFEDTKTRQLTRDAYEYYKNLKDIRNFTFKGIKLFFKLYKYESFDYKMKNLLILHFPNLAKIGFKIAKKKQEEVEEENNRLREERILKRRKNANIEK